MHSDQPGHICQKEIDDLISFYQARLYLEDSDFKILSDIAQDAQNIISFLEGKKEQLVMEMKDPAIDLAASQIRGLLLYKARYP